MSTVALAMAAAASSNPSSSSSSSSFAPPAKALKAPAAQDTLRRLLADLCTKNPVAKEEGILTLREHVESEARDLSGESFTRFVDSLHDKISVLVQSPSVADNLGAVHAIDELMEVNLGEAAAKISRFAAYLRKIFEEKTDPETILAASAALGHLARAGGALAADEVESFVKQALDWLQGDRVESRRFAAVLILKEMAENAPTVFNVHAPVFIDRIWSALRDAKLAVRERAVEALRNCLIVIEKRETRWRVQGYFRLFEETQRGLKSSSLESIHGSLLVIGEMLRNTGEFMMARYKAVAEIVAKYRDHRDRLVRNAITALVPRIAHFLRDRFVARYLKVCMDHLLGVMKNPNERDSGFAALGEMASAVGPALLPYLPAVAVLMREALAPRRGKPSLEALACLGSLAAAAGPEMADTISSLLEVCFIGGLTPTLVETMSQIAERLPSLLPSIQTNLLACITPILSRSINPRVASTRIPSGARGSLGSSSAPMGGAGSRSMTGAATGAAVVELKGPMLTQLALNALYTFDFSGKNLLDLIREHVLKHVEDEDPGTRREAAICCVRVTSQAYEAAPPRRESRRRAIVEEVVNKLLVVLVTDPDPAVRKAVLVSLSEASALTVFLVQSDSLRAIFVTLNDESFEVREQSIVLCGQLSGRNPAYVLPALRRHLGQLLVDVEQSSDTRQREDSARLLGFLIQACTSLMLHYVHPILKVLLKKLKEIANENSQAGMLVGGGGASGVVASMLGTVGEMSRVSGGALRPYLVDLMPLIIDAMQDGGNEEKREIAVTTLGQMAQSTGYVVTLYTEYPQLLGLLLRLLNGEFPWSTRRVVIQVLGILGALDPFTHKQNLLLLQSAASPDAAGVRAEVGAPADEMANELLPPGVMPVATSDEYFSTVAIYSLLKILRDGTLSTYHFKVVSSLVYVFRGMGLSCVNFLPKVMPDLFHVMRTGEDSLREFLCWQIAYLVTFVRQHFRKYIAELLSIVYEFWNPLLLSIFPRPPAPSPVLHLMEQLFLSLPDEAQQFLPEIIARCVAVITDAERNGDYSRVPAVLKAFEVFAASMEGSMHLLLPAIIRLFKPESTEAPIEIRRAALKSLARLLPSTQVSEHAAAMFHPLIRILDGTIDELRRDAVDTICALAIMQGPNFAIFIHSIRKLLQRHRITHSRFEMIASKIMRRDPSLLLELPASILSPALSAHHSRQLAGSQFPGSFPNLASMAGTKGNAGGGNVGGGLALSMGTRALPLIFDGESESVPDLEVGSGQALRVNEGNLRLAWESSHRSTKEDWAEWMRHFSVALLKESPFPALRTCAGLAQLQPHVARELFAAGFVSCWGELSEISKDDLVRSLEAGFASPNIPPETLATLLNLAEFMEHTEKPLPVDIRTLGALAEKCHAYAKALHYKEMQFEMEPASTVEALIHVNNQLQQHEAAVGILVYAQQNLLVELKESWYEKLQRWDEALEAYERKAASAPNELVALEATLGRMRCLAALARWDELNELCRESWAPAEPGAKLEMAPLGASAAWNMGEWDEMAEYVSMLEDGSDPAAASAARLNLPATASSLVAGPGTGLSDGAFFRAVLCVRRGQYPEAKEFVERARSLLGTELAALVLESYERAYADIVRVQQLAELEEVIEYSTLPPNTAASETRRAVIRGMWQERIRGAQRNIDVWQAILAVRSLVLPVSEDTHTQLKFASLCRKSGRVALSRSTLLRLLAHDPVGARMVGADDEVLRLEGVAGAGDSSGALAVVDLVRGQSMPAMPHVVLAYLKHVWELGGEMNRHQAFRYLQDLATELAAAAHAGVVLGPSGMGGAVPPGRPSLVAGLPAAESSGSVSLRSKVYLKLGTWQWVLQPVLSDYSVAEIEMSLRAATEMAPMWSKAWHCWALFNTTAMNYYTQQGNAPLAQRHLLAAIGGYFRSIALSTNPGVLQGKAKEEGVGGCLQDILRLLTLWFRHGTTADVQVALKEGFLHVNIDTWLIVIPQIIARIHDGMPAVRSLVQFLLVQIGRHHPQALMFPLLVACKSISITRAKAAQDLLDSIRTHQAALVDNSQLVSLELIRIAILWHEMWHEALEEASRLYFGEHNIEGMLAVLEPLHAVLQDQGPETSMEVSFVKAYGRELQEAYECCINFRRTGREAELTAAWDLYYHVFKRINKQLPGLTTLDLQHVSPNLLEAKNLELVVPGTYRAGAPVVTIASFAPQMLVITSKQRPRKISLQGSDGQEYIFLLKGHEDLRLDERIMQLFGLVNTLLGNTTMALDVDLSIQRYAVIPLSQNIGLIGWLPSCDTVHQVIREYREARNVPVNLEQRLILSFAPDYENLTVMGKVEVFQHALDSTPGNDLARVLWLKSRSAEVWLDRRTNFTRSLAVMSMVGYLLGLGDRHPSNLLLHRHSGKIIHIDFGDCFESSMNREKFPEKFPFRLTRMLVKAMEVSGIEGNFRFTCERVMTVLRQNKDSVMAMMEAFMYDPLINWRLIPMETGGGAGGGPAGGDGGGGGIAGGGNNPSPPQRGARERELLQALGQLDDAKGVLNERAVAVMTRMSNKLTGRDFPMPYIPGASLESPRPYASGVQGLEGSNLRFSGLVEGRSDGGISVKLQVQKLVAQAMSHENLCQSYIGWCPFW